MLRDAITTMTADAPIWRGALARNNLSQITNVYSQVSVGETWSWRRPWMFTYTITGPAHIVLVARNAARLKGKFTMLPLDPSYKDVTTRAQLDVLKRVKSSPAILGVFLAIFLLTFSAGYVLAEGNHSNSECAGCSPAGTRVRDTRALAPDPFANTKATLQTWDQSWWKGRVMLNAVRDFFNWAWRDFTLPSIPTDPATSSTRAGYGYTRYSGA